MEREKRRVYVGCHNSVFTSVPYLGLEKQTSREGYIKVTSVLGTSEIRHHDTCS